MAVVVRGVQLALHPPGDFVSDVIRETGDFYERAILDELLVRVAGGVLVDAGAMIGNHTAYLAAFVPHTRIHAFEPLPANLELLRRNVAAFPTVAVHDVALSDRPGVVRFLPDWANRGHSRITVDGSINVDAVTLDSYELEDVTLIKVDVEGHERQVLEGAAATLARCRPLLVVEDWSGPPAIPGYGLAVSWGWQHQTFLYEPLDVALTRS